MEKEARDVHFGTKNSWQWADFLLEVGFWLLSLGPSDK